MPGSLGASWHLGKEVVFLEVEFGSNHKPRASEADDLFTRRVRNILEIHHFQNAEKNVQDKSIFQN